MSEAGVKFWRWLSEPVPTARAYFWMFWVLLALMMVGLVERGL